MPRTCWPFPASLGGKVILTGGLFTGNLHVPGPGGRYTRMTQDVPVLPAPRSFLIMNFLLKKNLGSAWLIPLLGAILAVLASWQYRSTEQVSEATARDMEDSLRSALFDFRHALERDLSHLCLALQSKGGDSEVERPRDVSHRLNQWRQTTQHSALVSDVFLWDSFSQGEPILITPAGTHKSSAWPPSLAGLTAELRNSSLDSDDAVPAGSPMAGAPNKPLFFGEGSRLWMLDQKRLALLHPTFVGGERETAHIIWLVVPLEREYFTRNLLPELAKRQLGGHSANYKVAVVLDGMAPAVLYASEVGFGSSPNSVFDARLNLFGPPSLVRGKSLPHAGGVVIPASAESADVAPLFINPLVQSPGAPALAVIAQHRQGSLEVAVARLHERNLAVSFGVFGVLAITLTLIVITSQHARNLARMQMDFVAGVSHELRTPLTAILLAAKNLEDGVVGTNGLARYGAAIKNQAAQLSGLVEEILLFSETHSGYHVYKIEPVDVTLGIQNTLESLAPLIDSTGVMIEEDAPPDLPLALGDTAAFSQCLQNLITNSLKYGGDNKWIGVRAFVSENGGKKEICTSVEDRGLGIGNGELKQIFEPFYRSPEVVAAQIHGNGLGLPLTKTMVEAMRGRITVSSQPGKGSTFTIHLRPANGAA
ncbi:MAG: periplasmic sensor signal transduction histidine kinase [Candidatus Sulfotelmatobacter sp.]|nr:periplasmic sensor signal transduction histidine kinase [Candidatus Sulfotelmatobacter sp.]